MRSLSLIAIADESDRMGLFQKTAQRINTSPIHVEKDFWVCWTLDALYNRFPDGPRLLFKGGTSLSKVYGLIHRFSEDIDVTVFRTDLTEAHFPTDAEFTAMGRRPRESSLDRLRAACQAHINGPLKSGLERIAAEDFGTGRFRVEADASDSDGQTLLFHYPSVFPRNEAGYVRQTVKIESGARSALDPHSLATVKPYLADDVPDLDVAINNVCTVSPVRTFWDKVVILHGQRRWFDNRGEIYKNGDRVSRHYYDIHAMMSVPFGAEACADTAMAEASVAHCRLFFDRKPFDLANAAPGSFALSPAPEMMAAIRKDYQEMTGMMFGKPPSVDEVLDSVADLERILNTAPALAPI